MPKRRNAGVDLFGLVSFLVMLPRMSGSGGAADGGGVHCEGCCEASSASSQPKPQRRPQSRAGEGSLAQILSICQLQFVSEFSLGMQRRRRLVCQVTFDKPCLSPQGLAQVSGKALSEAIIFKSK